MTDVTPAENGAPDSQQPMLRVMTQFIRDLSFENPNAPDSLRAATAQPQMDVGVEMNARSRPDGLYEVDLKISANAQRDATAVFHCELLYGGLFQVTGFPEDQVEAILMIECPRLLFPFVRQIIGELSVQGGFPPFLLDPLDFAGIYFAQKQQQVGLQDAEPAGEA